MLSTVLLLLNTYEQWQIVFYILAGTYIAGAVCFVLLGSGELQPWNNATQKESPEKQEVQPLNEEKA